MPPKSNKSRREQTITYNLSNASARDAFEEELDLEEEAQQQRHTAGRGRRHGRGSAAFSLAADLPLSMHQGDLGGMHEYASPKATTDIINLLELFGSGSLDREVIESVYLGSNSNFEVAMELLMELAATSGNDGGSLGVGGGGTAADAGDGAAADAPAEAAAPAVCYWELLPNDLKRHVFSFLNSRDLARVARTCQDFAGPARSVRTNMRQLQIPTGLGMLGIMAMVGGHPNARAVSLRQWAVSPLSDSDFTALVVALSSGSRNDRRLVPVEALSFKGCRWLSDGHVMSLCNTMQHLKEVDLTDCVGITDAALVALAKYQRIAPEDSSSSSSDDEPPAAVVEAAATATPPLPTRPGTATTAAAVAAAVVAAVAPRQSQPSPGGGDGDADEELQFDFDVAAAPPVAAADAAAAAAVPLEARAAADGDSSDEEEGGDHRVLGAGGSSSGDDDDDGGDDGVGGVEVAAMSPSPSSALRGAFAAGMGLSPAARTRLGGASMPLTSSTAAQASGSASLEPRRASRGSGGGDSAASTPLYGTSPAGGAAAAGLMGASFGAGGSYGAARAAGTWLYGTSPAAAGTPAVVASGAKSWLYGSSPVMGASPFFRTGGSANISHNGWLAKAASAATHQHSGRGLMSINVSGCSSISSDGVRALLAAPLPKACLLQLDVSRCPRITRAALALPATSNLCVLRASACHNLHEVILQLPLSSPLTELHLADCKALSKLHVVAPALQQLHVGTCRHLTRLHLRCPQLRHLTASLCFRLVDLDPERWEVGRLEHLNLFGCRHLEWPGLAALLAKSGPSLRRLDINGCNAIVVADIPEANGALQHLDASGCKSLVALRCPSPALAALALRSCPRLQEVALESAALGRLDVSNCPHLQRLTMPALQQLAAAEQQPAPPPQQQQQQPAREAAEAAGGASGGGAGGAEQVGALRAAVSSSAAAGPEAGVAVRMAGCDRLPVEVAVLLRRLRDRAKQAAAAAGPAAGRAEAP